MTDGDWEKRNYHDLFILCPTCRIEANVEDDGVYLDGFCPIHGRFQLTDQDVKNYHESLKAKTAKAIQ